MRAAANQVNLGPANRNLRSLLSHQSDQLICCQGDDPKQQTGHYLGGPTDADRAAAKLFFQPRKYSFNRGALFVALRFMRRKLRLHSTTSGMSINQRHMAQRYTLLANRPRIISRVHQVIEIVYSLCCDRG